MAQIVKFTNSNGQSITFDRNRPFVFGKINGLSKSNTTVISDKTAAQDGELYQNSTLEKKQIILKINVLANTEMEYMEARRELISLFNPKLGEGEMHYYGNDIERKIKCVADGIPDMPIIGNIKSLECEFILLAHQPFLYLDKETAQFSTLEGGIHFPLAITSAGTNIGYRKINVIKSINNNGDVECGIVATIKSFGTVVNPSLTNIETKKTLKMNYTMAPGEIVLIDTRFGKKSIISIKNGIETNIINNYDPTSDFIDLLIGENTIQYNADIGVDTLSVTVDFIPLYLGV